MAGDDAEGRGRRCEGGEPPAAFAEARQVAGLDTDRIVFDHQKGGGGERPQTVVCGRKLQRGQQRQPPRIPGNAEGPTEDLTQSVSLAWAERLPGGDADLGCQPESGAVGGAQEPF